MLVGPGDVVDVRFTKWGGGPHWEFPVTLLGVDRLGAWCGAPDQPISVYVDVTTPPVWEGSTVTMVDLDLDVIVTRDGDLLLDDEDEFAEHRVTLACPDDVVAMARRTADELLAAAWDGREPFGAAAADWLARLETMSA